MDKKNNQNIKPKAPKTNWFLIIMGLSLGLFLFLQFFGGTTNSAISSEDFLTNYFDKGLVKELVVHNNDATAEVFLTEAGKKYYQSQNGKTGKGNMMENLGKVPDFSFNFGTLEEFQKDIKKSKEENNLSANTEVFYNPPSPYDGLFTTILLYALFFGLIWFIFFRRVASGGGAGSQIFNIGKSRAKLFDENNDVKTTFKNVAGLEGAKEEVQEVVDFLKNPDKYTKLGGKIPKGVLLVGPPGTGKTLLAKAVAGEAKVPFFSLSGSDFVEMFVGVGASRVRDLFNQAKAKSPAIIFIDEIDAIGRARGKGGITGGNDERENTLNQLLTEMDGFGSKTNVIVMAATNRADVLDSALLRPGRFDRTIAVDLPELNERKEIFEVHTSTLKMDDSIDLDFLAHQTPGFSGADIANLCNEAALIAARKNKNQIGKQDFLDAVDRIIGGLEKKNKIIKPKEKERIAYHEAGHATVSWFLEHAAPLVKVTIVPRGRSLGAAWYLPDERQITTKEQLQDEMCSLLGGRAAEEVKLGNYSTGAQNDLERAFKQANAMVTIFGLSDEIGHISYYDSTGQTDFSITKPYSEKTAEKIDSEIKDIIQEQYERAVKILEENKEKFFVLAEKLKEKEVIFKEDLVDILGPSPFENTSKKMEETSENTAEKAEENV